jgi:hypothetical protein
MGVFEYIKKVTPKHTWQRHLVTCFIFALLAWIGLAFFTHSGERRANEWIEDDKAALLGILDEDPQASSGTAESVVQRLRSQRRGACVRALRHIDIAVHFQARRYMGLIMATLCGVLAGACFVWISRKGWNSSDPHIVAIFLLASIGTAFFGSFTTLFEHKENINTHMSSYAESVAIANEVSTALALRDLGDAGISMADLKTKMLKIDERFKTLDLIPVGMASADTQAMLDMYTKPVEVDTKQ